MEHNHVIRVNTRICAVAAKNQMQINHKKVLSSILDVKSICNTNPYITCQRERILAGYYSEQLTKTEYLGNMKLLTLFLDADSNQRSFAITNIQETSVPIVLTRNIILDEELGQKQGSKAHPASAGLGKKNFPIDSIYYRLSSAPFIPPRSTPRETQLVLDSVIVSFYSDNKNNGILLI